jgi:hypothetical protein
MEPSNGKPTHAGTHRSPRRKNSKDNHKSENKTSWFKTTILVQAKQVAEDPERPQKCRNTPGRATDIEPAAEIQDIKQQADRHRLGHVLQEAIMVLRVGGRYSKVNRMGGI